MGVNRDEFPIPSNDSKYNSARFTPSQSNRSNKRRTPSAATSKHSQLVRFISFRQSSAASCCAAVFSRHAGCASRIARSHAEAPATHTPESLAMTGFNQLLQVAVALLARFIKVPGSYVQCGDSSASAGQSNPDPHVRGNRNRRRPITCLARKGVSTPRSHNAWSRYGNRSYPRSPGGPATHKTAPLPRRAPAIIAAPVQRSFAKTVAPSGRSNTGNSRAFSQTIARLGLCTSVRAPHAHVFFPPPKAEFRQ